MKCMCGNLQCYVCSSDIADYTHFGDGMMCPLYGDMQTLWEEQVAVAEERTVRELLETRAGLEDDDIRVDKRVDTDRYNRINLEAPRPALAIQPPLQWYPWAATPALNGFDQAYRPRVHECIRCHKTFGSVESLSQHQNAKQHNEINMAPAGPIRCFICNKSFHSPHSLSQHQRDKHGSGAHISKRKRSGSFASDPPKRRRV
jgi:hypothetical protein